MATPNTDLIFRTFANGIRKVDTGKFYPFLVKTLATTESLAAKPNIRFYVRECLVNFASDNDDIGTSLTVIGVVNHETLNLVNITRSQPVVAERTVRVPVGILLDLESPVTFTAANLTAANCQVFYAEVDDIAGQEP